MCNTKKKESMKQYKNIDVSIDDVFIKPKKMQKKG